MGDVRLGETVRASASVCLCHMGAPLMLPGSQGLANGSKGPQN